MTPQVGDILHYYFDADAQPLPAMVLQSYAHAHDLVDVKVFDMNGDHTVNGVKLLQDWDTVPQGLSVYCRWIPQPAT